MPELPRPEKPELKPEPAAPEESAGMSLFSNALAIIGFIIIAVIVIWGLVHFISLASPWFSSLFPTSHPSVEVSAPETATSGEPVTIDWQYSNGNAGSYSFLYQCVNDFQFGILGSNNTMQEVPCGTGFAVGSSTSATLIPLLAGTSGVSVPVSVVFTPATSGTLQAQGSATIAIVPSSNAQPAQTTQATTTPTQTISPAHPQQPVQKVQTVPVGSADLSVSIITVGVIDPSSGALLSETPTSPSQTIGVEFEIRNNGPEATGPYVFQAHLPTESSYTYTSPVQASLQPGAHVVNTLRFTQGVPGGIFTVDVDTANQVNDPNRANNEAAQTIY